MPLEVMELGGWLSRDTADAFADYAELAAGALGDRVTAWTTVNEPLVQMAYGYAVGIDAPGLTLLGGAFQATHHQLLAHGRAVQVLRSAASGSVGIINHHTCVDPAGRNGADIAAARFYDAYHNRQFADPLLLGRISERHSRHARRGDRTSSPMAIWHSFPHRWTFTASVMRTPPSSPPRRKIDPFPSPWRCSMTRR